MFRARANKLLALEWQVVWRALIIALTLAAAVIAGYQLALGQNPLLVLLLPAIPLGLLVMSHPFAGLLLLIAMIPLETGFFAVTVHALSYTRLVGICVFIAWAAHVVLQRKKIYTTVSFKLFTLLFAWASLSLLWAWDKDVALLRLQVFAQMLAFYLLVLNEVNNRRRLVVVVAVFVGSCVLAALLGLIDVGGTADNLRRTLSEVQAANEYAFYVGIALLSSFLLYAFGPWRLKVLAACAAAVGIVPVLAAGARMAFLAMGLALVSVVLVGRRKWRLLIVGVIAAGVLYSSFDIWKKSGIMNEHIITRLSTTAVLETRGSGRLDIWAVGLRLARENLLLGTGLDNFKVGFGTYLVETETVRVIRPGRGAHNDYLQVLGDLGLVGLLLFLAVLLNIGRRLVAIVRSDLDAEAVLLATLVLGLLVFALSASLVDVFLWRKAYWLILALAASAPDVLLGNRSNDAASDSMERRS